MKQRNKFKIGNKVAVGHKGAGGRPPDWLKEKCQRLIEEKKIVEFIASVADGEYVDNVISASGEKMAIKVSAKVDERLKAAGMLLDRAFGKATENRNVTGNITIDRLIMGDVGEELLES